MPFGPDVVELVSLTNAATPGQLGTYAKIEQVTVEPGCHHRPLTFSETAELQYDIATELWRTTIPIGEYSEALRTAVLQVTAGDLIRVDGQEYRIVGGVRPFKDFSALFKATIVSQKHTG
jgi:hypothetical protein